MKEAHSMIWTRGKAFGMSDGAIAARIAAVDYHEDVTAATRAAWAERVEFAKSEYSAEHLAGKFLPRIRKTLARWASGKGNLPTPMELQFLASIAAYDEVGQ